MTQSDPHPSNPNDPQGQASASGWQPVNEPGPAQPADQWQTARPPEPYGTGGQPGTGYPQQPTSAGYPQDQSSAGYVGSQSSAGYPTGQSFGSYPQGQGYQQGQDPAVGFGQQQPGPVGYPGWQQPASGPADRKFDDANPLRAAFDFGFNRYATPGLVKIIYVLAVVIAAVWWIGGTITTFVLGAAVSDLGRMTTGSGGGGGGIVLGIVSLLLGWIPALLWVLLVRVVLEAAMALVRVAEDARGIREKVSQ